VAGGGNFPFSGGPLSVPFRLAVKMKFKPEIIPKKFRRPGLLLFVEQIQKEMRFPSLKGRPQDIAVPVFE